MNGQGKIHMTIAVGIREEKVLNIILAFIILKQESELGKSILKAVYK